MSSGWTGGQYSVFRIVLGAYLAQHFAVLALSPGPSLGSALLGMIALFSVLLAVGYQDRVAALVLLGVGAYLCMRHVVAFRPSLVYLGVLLLAHVCLPSAPYGSWSARGRVDPGGSWSMPRSVYLAVWIAASLAFFPMARWRAARPWIWVISFATHLAVMVTMGFAEAIGGVILLHFLAFDPDWVRPLSSPGTDTLFYDGHCGLCHRAVRFVLAEDRSGHAFRFAALDSDAFRAALSAPERDDLPDSMVVRCASGDVLTRSSGIRYIMARLGGLWRLIASVVGVLPRSLLDRLYDGVARIRHRLFAPPPEACPILPEHLRARFEPT